MRWGFVLYMLCKSAFTLQYSNINHNLRNNDKPATQKNFDTSITDNLSIFYYGPVTEESCLQLTQALGTMNDKAKQQKAMSDQIRPYIPLHIQSGGGSLMPSFYVCDYIENSETPIYTYIDGFCASAASLMSVCGEKRYMTKHSSMLIHQLSGVAKGKFAELKTEVNNLNFFMNYVKDIYLKHTKLDEQTLNALLETDIWLNATTCLKYGLIDEII